ncbi:kinase-like domain-containing protein [Amanita rubescens]|nr:kinase-like domain-containing protein [Amanita rubescens]
MEQNHGEEDVGQSLPSLLEALDKLTILGHSTVNEDTLHLVLQLLDTPKYDIIASKLTTTSDVELLLDFLLDALRQGSLTICGANKKARRLLSKLISMTNVIPQSLFVANVVVDLGGIDVGGFGHVFKGLHEGKQVAVKILYRIRQEGNTLRKEVCREALIWRSLSHRYILPLRGIFEEKSQLFLVSPFMENGTLTQWRKNRRLVVNEVQRLILEVAEAIQYLHSEGIVHGDLHGGNVLLDPEFHCQIADFGTTRHSEASVTRSTKTFNLHFAAPELFGVCTNCNDPQCDGCFENQKVRHRNKTMKTDVYAFGCLYYVTFFNTIPFQGRNNFQVVRLVTGGMRPTRLESPRMEDNTWNLIENCWKFNPSERLTMEQIVRMLRPDNPLGTGPSHNELLHTTRGKTTKRARKASVAQTDLKSSGPPLSPVMHFIQDQREIIKAENPDAGFSEVGRLLATKWKQLNEEEKKPYFEQAAQDKASAGKEKYTLSPVMRFIQDQREIIEAENPDAGFSEVRRLLATKWKQLNEEEKKVDRHEIIKAENPDANFGEMGRLLGVEWKQLNDEEKKPYFEQAAQDKARAEKEILLSAPTSEW